MVSNRAKLAWLVAAGFVLPAGSLAIAEETGRKIEEVIVTAERREASIQDTSMSITAFTTEFMDDLVFVTRKISRTLFLPPPFSPTMQRFASHNSIAPP